VTRFLLDINVVIALISRRCPEQSERVYISHASRGRLHNAEAPSKFLDFDRLHITVDNGFGDW
jgi:hypothetical protein